jgi:preprotein translocase subunit SecF
VYGHDTRSGDSSGGSMPNIIGRRYLWFLNSLLVIIPGIVAMIYATYDSCNKQSQGQSNFCGPLHPSIDFTGGTLWELSNFDQAVAPNDVRSVFQAQGITDVAVQTSSQGNVQGVLIRTIPLTGDDGKAKKAELQAALQDKLGAFQELRFESVGPVIGQEVSQRAIWAVVAASLAILLYISFAFRGVAHSVRFGVCAVIALIHDVLVVIGIFSIFGLLFGTEVDALILTAILTIIGFSVHDTIVVFDRIRENRRKFPTETFERVVNFSVFQTLDRSINTTLTVLMTLSALFLFGGVTIRSFTAALLIGVFSGTYSSIFNASPLLVVWETGEIPRFFARLFGRQKEVAAK